MESVSCFSTLQLQKKYIYVFSWFHDSVFYIWISDPPAIYFDVKEKDIDPHLIVFHMASCFSNAIYWIIHFPPNIEPLLSYFKFPHTVGATSGLSIVFYWSFCLFYYMCQIALFTLALEYIFITC